MSYGQSKLTRGKGSAKGAGRIALDNKQVGRIHRQQALCSLAHKLRMDHRVGLPRAIEMDSGEYLQPMVGKLKTRMLTGDEQPRGLAEVCECARDGTQFDGFGTRTDD